MVGENDSDDDDDKTINNDESRRNRGAGGGTPAVVVRLTLLCSLATTLPWATRTSVRQWVADAAVDAVVGRSTHAFSRNGARLRALAEGGATNDADALPPFRVDDDDDDDVARSPPLKQEDTVEDDTPDGPEETTTNKTWTFFFVPHVLLPSLLLYLAFRLVLAWRETGSSSRRRRSVKDGARALDRERVLELPTRVHRLLGSSSSSSPDADTDTDDSATTTTTTTDAPMFACCSVCLEDFVVGETLRILTPCGHAFHTECVLPWLTERQGCCPLCKASVVVERA